MSQHHQIHLTLMKIVKLIDQERANTPLLADRLNISTRQVYRYIKYLRLHYGFEIANKGKGKLSYYVILSRPKP